MILKNLKYLVLSFAVGTAFLSGCGTDEEVVKKEEPTITINYSVTPANNTVLKPSTEITIDFSAAKGVDGKDIASVKISRSSYGAAFTEISNVTKIGKSSYSDSKKITVGELEGTEVIKIEVTSEDATKTASTTLKYTIKKDSIPGVTKPKLNSAVTFNKDKQFYASSNGNLYTNSEAQANKSNVDLTYFFSPTSGNNLASPVARNDKDTYTEAYAITWGTVSTEIRTTSLSQSEFNALKDKDQKDIVTAFNNGTPGNVINNPAGTRINKESYIAGKVIAFKNSLGKYGLIYINSIAATETGASSVDVLVQN